MLFSSRHDTAFRVSTEVKFFLNCRASVGFPENIGYISRRLEDFDILLLERNLCSKLVLVNSHPKINLEYI